MWGSSLARGSNEPAFDLGEFFGAFFVPVIFSSGLRMVEVQKMTSSMTK